MSSDLLTFLEMLSFKRPSFSATEQAFCNLFIKPLPTAVQDTAGNWIVQIGNASDHRTLFSSHTDTVHTEEGFQRVVFRNGIIFIPKRQRGKTSCLGADCTAGVWLMIEMIKAKIPGLYIFHTGEECGGVGAYHILHNAFHFLKDIDIAIAFDRQGTSSVVTHQIFQTASSEFANSLADLLSEDWPENRWTPDAGGIFTDTRIYASVVPECTNISVGYSHAHTPLETQDFNFLLRLRDQLIKVGPRIRERCNVVRNPWRTVRANYKWPLIPSA